MARYKEGSYQRYTFSFGGWADIEEGYRRGDGDPESGEVVSGLNKDARSIARQINDTIEPSLPEGFSVDTRIEFFEGSIEWLGVVMLTVAAMDWMSRISGTVDFFEKLAKLIHFAAEGPVRRSISRYGPIRPNGFRMTVNPPLNVPLGNPSNPVLDEILTRQRELSRLLQTIIQNQNAAAQQLIQRQQGTDLPKIYGFLALLLIVLITLEVIAILR